MNKSITQFAVAIIGMMGLVSATLIAIIYDKSYAELLVGGLISTGSMATAYLFRLNGTK